MKHDIRKTYPLAAFALLIVLISGCTEDYDVDITTDAHVLVVDGTLTNDPEATQIRLSYASVYGTAASSEQVTGAKVMVVGTNHDTLLFGESANGVFILPAGNPLPKPGINYQLSIRTSDGFEYRSDMQPMTTMVIVDSIHGKLEEIDFLRTRPNGSSYIETEMCVTSLADFKNTAGPDVQVRFKSTLLYGYTYPLDPNASPTSTIYEWKKLDPDRVINFTGSANEVSFTSLSDYAVCSFPLNNYLYNVTGNEYINIWLLKVRLFTISHAAFDYYKKVNAQLTSSNRLFDPIAAGVEGNMTCTTDPSRRVLGFFEVSAYTEKSLWVKPLITENFVTYRSSYDLDSIPDKGKQEASNPFWWPTSF